MGSSFSFSTPQNCQRSGTGLAARLRFPVRTFFQSAPISLRVIPGLKTMTMTFWVCVKVMFEPQTYCGLG